MGGKRDNKEWDLNWKNPLSRSQDIREAMTLRRLILQSLECSWFDTILVYFQVEATHSKTGGFHKKPSQTGEVKPDVLKLGATQHVQMSRHFRYFSDTRPPRWLLYKKIKISILNIQDLMPRSYYLPKQWTMFSPHHFSRACSLRWKDKPLFPAASSMKNQLFYLAPGEWRQWGTTCVDHLSVPLTFLASWTLNESQFPCRAVKAS